MCPKMIPSGAIESGRIFIYYYYCHDYYPAVSRSRISTHREAILVTRVLDLLMSLAWAIDCICIYKPTRFWFISKSIFLFYFATSIFISAFRIKQGVLHEVVPL